MKNPALAMKLAVALTLAACGPADAGNAPATVAAAGASGAQDLPMVAEVGFSDLLRDPATPFIGAENADIIIIGFMDYNCPYCKMMIPELEGLMKADPKVRILYKEWPIFGAVSENVARLAMAANYQGKYHEVHKAFMGAKGRIETDQQARSLARAAGVDMNQTGGVKPSEKALFTLHTGRARRNPPAPESGECAGTGLGRAGTEVNRKTRGSHPARRDGVSADH